VPAPWIQIKLLKLLALLGTNDQRASEGMYEVLNDVMRRADTGINIGYAVIYDCVRTVTTIYPNIPLLEAAAAHIARFVQSENHNLKYLGIKALAQIVQVRTNPEPRTQALVQIRQAMRPSCPVCSTCSTRRVPSPLSPLSLSSPHRSTKSTRSTTRWSSSSASRTLTKLSSGRPSTCSSR
jgi:hypothetical protein